MRASRKSPAARRRGTPVELTLKEYKQGSASGGTTSLGDLLKEQLEQES